MNAFSLSATPVVNLASRYETLQVVNAIKAGLPGIGGAVQQPTQSVSRTMNLNPADG